jgi:intein-encoded DNA endonuclease-like protein
MCLSTSNKRLFSFLESAGYMDRLSGPRFSLDSHWFRGFFDGDGCIYVHRRGAKQVVFSGPFLQDWTFLTAQLDQLEIDHKVNTLTPRKGRSSRVRFQGRNPCVRFGEFLYGDAIFGLARKREKFAQIEAAPVRRRRAA